MTGPSDPGAWRATGSRVKPGMTSPLTQPERMKHANSGVSVVGRVDQLRLGQARVGPVRGGRFVRLDEAPVEQNCHGALDAHVLAVTAVAEDRVELQHVCRLHAQLALDALAVVAQAEARLDHARKRQQLRHHGAAFQVVQLEHPGFVQRRQLHDVRTFRHLVLEERRLGFGVEAPDAGCRQLGRRRVSLGRRRHQLDAVQPQPVERLQQGYLRFVGRGVAGMHENWQCRITHDVFPRSL